MNLNTYQELAARTANADMPIEQRRVIAALGIVGEVGELCDLIKKIEGHGHPMDAEALGKEVGDVLWYCAEMASTIGADLSTLAIAKTFDALMGGCYNWRTLTRASAALVLGADAGGMAEKVASGHVRGIDTGVGVLLYSLASIAHLYGLDIDTIAQENIEKLKRRYPAGFSTEASMARVDTKENPHAQ